MSSLKESPRTTENRLLPTFPRDEYDCLVPGQPPGVINVEPDPLSWQPTINHHMPTVAVNNKGEVGISWYDGRNQLNGQNWWTRFPASLDGGETFLNSVAVSESSHTRRPDTPIRIGARSNFRDGTIVNIVRPFFGEFSGGDTAGIAADANGVFHPVWVDNRSGFTPGLDCYS